MDAPAPVPDVQSAFASRRRLSDRIGDTALHVITGAAAFGAVAVLGLIVYRLIYGAWPSIDTVARTASERPAVVRSRVRVAVGGIVVTACAGRRPCRRG